jgi:hypothetical protein
VIKKERRWLLLLLVSLLMQMLLFRAVLHLLWVFLNVLLPNVLLVRLVVMLLLKQLQKGITTVNKETRSYNSQV